MLRNNPIQYLKKTVADVQFHKLLKQVCIYINHMGNITSISVLFFTNMDNYNMGRFLEYTKQYNKSYDTNQDYEDAFNNFNYNIRYHCYRWCNAA